MSKLGKCCCDCCIDPTEMPWTTVTLKNQLTGCTTGGGYSPPTSTFERTNCCYTATFNVSCDWEYTCGLWASQTGTFSFGVDQYKPKVAYVGPGDTASCPCVLVQSRTVAGTVTGRVNFFNRRRLSSIQITVGKTLVQCAEDASPVCRFYIATTYNYEVCESISGMCFAPDWDIDYTCTGIYRDTECSITNSWTSTSPYPTCTDIMNSLNVFGECTEGGGGQTTSYSFDRIKFYDALPGTDVTIGSGDKPPASCCTSKTSCQPTQRPCGTTGNYDECTPNLSAYSGAEFPAFCGCEPVPESLIPGFHYESTGEQCPTKVDKIAFDAWSRIFYGTTCKVHVQNDTSYRCNYSAPGFDKFGGCLNLVNDTTNEAIDAPFAWSDFPWLDAAFLTCLGGDTPPPAPAGCFVTGGCSDGKCGVQSATGSTSYIFCPEFEDEYCRIDIKDFTCSVGSVVNYTTGSVCYTAKSVTLGFS